MKLAATLIRPAFHCQHAPPAPDFGAIFNQDRAWPRLLPALACAGLALTAAVLWRRESAFSGVGSGRSDADRGGTVSELRRWYEKSDADVFETTRQDVKRFVEAKGAASPSVFGLSRGPYSKMSNYTRLHKLAGFEHGERPEQGSRFTCNFVSFQFQPANSTATPADAPPHASLLLPGLLSQRPNLSNTALCFLFYAEQFWTRATGGAKGVALARVVAGNNRVGDKEVFAESLAKYQSTCKAPASAGRLGGFPRTVLLKNKDECEKFFRENHLWAPEDESLWFVKDANGSLGRHIQLLRGADVRAMAANGSYTCPMPGRVASLEVERMWIPGKRKFDQRYYVLIPSLNPLIVLVRRGYLRFSAFEYQRDKMPGEDDELDRMRHVTNLAIQLYDAARRTDSKHSAGAGPFPREHRYSGEGVGRREGGADGQQVLQPVARLRELLIQSLGEGQGERAYERLETSARNAILQVLYPFLERIRFLDDKHKSIHTHSYSGRHTYAYPGCVCYSTQAAAVGYGKETCRADVGAGGHGRGL